MAQMVAMSGAPPICREQAFLETYFQCLSQFAYDKAKDACEKERETYKLSSGTTWGLMVNALIQLALTEKTYTSLMFLGQKWFGRKDNLRATYSVLLSELKKIEETTGRPDLSVPSPVGGASSRTDAAMSSASETVTDLSLEKLFSHLAGQLSQYLKARSKTMDFYEQMATMGTNRNMNMDDLLIVITDIIQAHQRNFHHPILAPLKYSFSLECEIVHHLLRAQTEMAVCQFLSSLLNLNDAQSKLTAWTALFPPRETKKLSFGGSKSPPIPWLYQWLQRYKCILVSKFSLYFYDILSKQAPATEVKALQAKTTVDFHNKIVTFQKRADAANVSLVLDTTGLGTTGLDTMGLGWVQRGVGYHHPDKFTEPTKGLDSFPAIFSCPQERAERHWPSVISILTDKSMALSTVDKHVYFCDEKLQSTYFLSKIEPRITLVIIFEAKKAEKDSYVNNFVVEITTQLRCTKLFASLKPGMKA